MRARVRPALAGLVVVLLSGSALLAGCAGGSSADAALSPTDALSQAKQHLDDTSGVQLSLMTGDTPSGDSYLTGASGVITSKPPAFEGTASGKYQGFSASDIDVVSADDTFEVKLPIKGYTKLDPSTLCAPDPAQLLQPDSGVSSVLTAATDVTAGSAQRGGQDNKETLTPYSGTVPGTAIRNILPCSKGDTYDATFDIDADGYLRSATLTGDFFDDGEPITYTLSVDAYDVTKDISLP